MAKNILIKSLYLFLRSTAACQSIPKMGGFKKHLCSKYVWELVEIMYFLHLLHFDLFSTLELSLYVFILIVFPVFSFVTVLTRGNFKSFVLLQ